jgi:uncharacterized membrane protein YgdD (TMEM256/DUF423 family)
MEKRFLVLGSTLFCFAIILGAFGAHALKDLITPTKLNSFEVGVRYQMFNSLAVIVLALNARVLTFELKNILRLMIVGIILFSFSIYFLALSDLLALNLRFLGPITPLGGLLLILSWGLFIFKLIKSNK